MRKVLHVISKAEYGDGITEVVKNLSLSIDRERFELSVCSLQGRGDAVVDFEAMGIQTLCLNARSSASPAFVVQNTGAVWELVRIIRRERFDIVHSHGFFAGVLGRTAARLARTPVIILSLHNAGLWKRRPHILIDRCLARLTDKIVTNSEAVKQFTAKHEQMPLEKLTVICNGIDLARFDGEIDGTGFRQECGIGSQETVVGTVGHLIEQKGQRYFIDAAEIIYAHRKDTRFIVVGGEPSDRADSVAEELHQLVERYALEGVVIFTGLRQDIPQVMAGFDIFVLPSLSEGFGLVAAEAMAAGKPVVASRIPALSEVVEDGESGILAPVGDAEALARAILELMDSPEKTRAMGRAGRRRVEELFTCQRMAPKYEALYESLSGNRS